MKQYAVLCLIVAIIMLVTPTVTLISGKIYETGGENITEEDSAVYSDNDNKHEKTTYDDNTVSVFMSEDGKTENIPLREYIIGVVAAEMPASYETEALKAQALVAVTYTRYVREKGDKKNDADITDDSSTHQGYMTDEQMQEKWGDAYESYRERIETAVDDVLDKVIVHDGKPIMAAYHAISSGRTESALNLWGKDIPYLQSTDSEWDKNSARYTSSVSLTAEELTDLCKKKKTDNADGGLIEITSVSESGTVLEVILCGEKMSGTQLRELLSLRSPVFNAEYSDGEYIFTVSGYGHGVGMSQNGANVMAKNGSTYDEIIKHYYKDVEIETFL